MDPSLGKWVSFILATSCWVGAVRGLGCPYLASCQWGRPVRAADVYPGGVAWGSRQRGQGLISMLYQKLSLYFVDLLLLLLLSHTSHVWLCVTPQTAAHQAAPGVPGILQARILEWVVSNVCIYAKSLQLCLTLCDPTDGSPPGSPALGFSRQEHWSGLPFPSPMHESESEVAQLCLTLRDPTDWSLPGSCIHGIFQARVLEWGAIAFSIELG